MSFNNSVGYLSNCGNATDENGRKTDPLTLEPLPRDVTLLIKIGNQCYSRQSIRDFLLSNDSIVAIDLDDGTMDEWTTGALGRIRDPMTNVPFTLEVLTSLYWVASHNRERDAKGSRRRRHRSKRRHGSKRQEGSKRRHGSKRQEGSRRRHRSKRRR